MPRDIAARKVHNPFQSNGTNGARRERSFTLLELIAVVSILAVLATIVIVVSPMVFKSVERVRCMGNLRSLHAALGTYLSDNNRWPQLPKDVAMNSPQEDAWWRETLKAYGMTDKTWHCPTLSRTAKQKNMQEALAENHYLPTLFDAAPATPYRWPAMPWAMEVGNNHGSGLLIVTMGGTVLTYDEFYRNAAK
jgi:prepilin-type N-terminal cleavage/methylation domain-containing protein